MRTPQEIKKGLQCCSSEETCVNCPYRGTPSCIGELTKDASALVELLTTSHNCQNSIVDMLWDEIKRLSVVYNL